MYNFCQAAIDAMVVFYAHNILPPRALIADTADAFQMYTYTGRSHPKCEPSFEDLQLEPSRHCQY